MVWELARVSVSFKADPYLWRGVEQVVEERKHGEKSEHGRIFYLTSMQEGKQQWAGMW